MAFIKAISYYLPDKILGNQDIIKEFPEWTDSKIIEKIGVETRRISGDDEFSSDLATRAIQKLLSTENISAKEIDFLNVCTQTPDYLLPTTACLVQQKVGLPTSCGAIDINQGCSGYIYGLSVAKGLVATKNFKNVLLVTADTYSKIIHQSDKGNRTIFGDAATATLVSDSGQYKIGEFTFGTDGSGAENLILKNSGMKGKTTPSTEILDDFLFMEGKKIFNFVIKYVPSVLKENLALNHFKKEDIDWFVYHQANSFMLERLRQEFDIPKEKFVLEMLNCGNTTSSSVPIALKVSLENTPETPNKNIQLAGFGVGYSWGAVCISKA